MRIPLVVVGVLVMAGGGILAVHYGSMAISPSHTAAGYVAEGDGVAGACWALSVVAAGAVAVYAASRPAGAVWLGGGLLVASVATFFGAGLGTSIKHLSYANAEFPPDHPRHSQVIAEVGIDGTVRMAVCVLLTMPLIAGGVMFLQAQSATAAPGPAPDTTSPDWEPPEQSLGAALGAWVADEPAHRARDTDDRDGTRVETGTGGSAGGRAVVADGGLDGVDGFDIDIT